MAKIEQAITTYYGARRQGYGKGVGFLASALKVAVILADEREALANGEVSDIDWSVYQK